MTDKERTVELIGNFARLTKELETENEVTAKGKYRIREFYKDELRKDAELDRQRKEQNKQPNNG